MKVVVSHRRIIPFAICSTAKRGWKVEGGNSGIMEAEKPVEISTLDLVEEFQPLDVGKMASLSRVHQSCYTMDDRLFEGNRDGLEAETLVTSIGEYKQLGARVVHYASCRMCNHRVGGANRMHARDVC